MKNSKCRLIPLFGIPVSKPQIAELTGGITAEKLKSCAGQSSGTLAETTA